MFYKILEKKVTSLTGAYERDKAALRRKPQLELTEFELIVFRERGKSTVATLRYSRAL